MFVKYLLNSFELIYIDGMSDMSNAEKWQHVCVWEMTVFLHCYVNPLQAELFRIFFNVEPVQGLF